MGRVSRGDFHYYLMKDMYAKYLSSLLQYRQTFDGHIEQSQEIIEGFEGMYNFLEKTVHPFIDAFDNLIYAHREGIKEENKTPELMETLDNLEEICFDKIPALLRKELNVKMFLKNIKNDRKLEDFYIGKVKKGLQSLYEHLDEAREIEESL